MKKLLFEQDRRLSRDTLKLDGDQLIVSTTVAGLKAEKTIALESFAPNFERKKRVFFSFVFIPMLLAGGMAFAVSKLLSQQMLPRELAIAPLIGFGVSLWYVAVGFRPIEVAVFRNKAGVVLIEVYRPKGRRIAYEEFVLAVAENARAAQSTASN